MRKVKRIKAKFSLPKIIRSMKKSHSLDEFPLKHYSYSTFVKFSTNPIMFKINYINGERIETTNNIASVIGQAFHYAMELKEAEETIINGLDPIKTGLEGGLRFIEEFSEGMINYSSVVKNKQKAQELFAFAYASYLKDKEDTKETIVSCEEMIETSVDVSYRDKKLILPVPLKGYIDKIVRDEEGRLKVIDYKTSMKFSDPEKIDGSKIIQAVQYYLLVYAQYGEEPYSITFEEVKMSKNRDGGAQLKCYEIVYAENEQFFDFYFRLYDDMTRAINGEMVFVPNIMTFWDNEVSIVAYIHRLDNQEEVANLMREMQVSNITELLKKQIHNAGNMRKFLATAEKHFISSKSLNYDSMTIEERIVTKLMEHGMMIKYEDTISGLSVNLYRFNPSIGLKMGKLMSYSADIEQAVGSANIRVLAPIPNSTLVGVEVPKTERGFPGVAPKTEGFELAMGVDIFGETKFFDVRKAPHLLVCGASGSGKSVFLNSVISQLIGKCELYLFDPKRVELSQFEKEATQYLDDHETISIALEDIVKDMEARYRKMKELGVRTIEGTDIPYRFVVIDEFGDLTIGSEFSKDIMKNITLLAQKARACGIHMIISTQRPSVDIITGTIKNNFTTKAVFRVGRSVDSQLVLDEAGAEKLLGMGDMIFASDEGRVRLQGFSN